MSSREPIGLEQALIIVAITFAGALGAGMLIWMGLILLDLVHAQIAAITAGTAGLGVTLKLARRGK